MLLLASITEIVVRYRHQDHQRCYGPQLQKLWSGTGTEDVRRELQELALHKTMSIWLIMGFINISVRPDSKTANSVGHEGKWFEMQLHAEPNRWDAAMGR